MHAGVWLRWAKTKQEELVLSIDKTRCYAFQANNTARQIKRERYSKLS